MNSKTMRLPALGVLMILLLAACNMPITATPLPAPTLTVEPPAVDPNLAGAACLVGSWQMNDFNQYLQTALPQVTEGVEVQIEEVSGSLTYTFNTDGTTLGSAQDFRVNAQVTTNGLTLPGEITLNGSTQGQYAVDESQSLLTVSSVTPGDLTLSANVSGIPIVSDTPVNDLLMFGADQSGSSSTEFDCTGNTLSLRVNVPDLGTRTLVLNRVQP
jgi:hypothetical protein